jgi:hypothetical protein
VLGLEGWEDGQENVIEEKGIKSITINRFDVRALKYTFKNFKVIFKWSIANSNPVNVNAVDNSPLNSPFGILKNISKTTSAGSA